jgi:tRNA-dihydrouridine synthase 2
LVLQLGTADPENAVLAALKVHQDVAGIDVNCGYVFTSYFFRCPKKFSVVSSMGSALLSDPDRLESILRALVLNIPLPISCKIRLIPPTQDMTYLESTLKFVDKIQGTGISALTVHCRFTHEKPRDPGHWEIFQFLKGKVKIPLIANGDIFSSDDIDRLRDLNVADSFMLARAAQSNPSVFRKEGLLPIEDVMMDYVNLADKYQMNYKNAKYALVHMMAVGKEGIKMREALNSAKSIHQMKYIIEKFKEENKKRIDYL